MKKAYLLILFAIVFSIQSYANNSVEIMENNKVEVSVIEISLVNVDFESDLRTSCMDVAIAYANAQLDAGHITSAQWFGVVNATYAVCNLANN